MHAGIDCGSSLIKAYWRRGGSDRFRTVDLSTGGGLVALVAALKADGVRRIRLVGIGAKGGQLDEFATVFPAAAAVDDEIVLQAAGVRFLMNRSTRAPKKMLIASIGTGVSYTKVSGKSAKRHKLGSAHGGGTIMGLARMAGAQNFAELERAAAIGTAPDLLVKHWLPQTEGTPLGDLIIAHFSKKDATFEDNCAGIMSFAAASIFKDIAVLRSIPLSPKEVVVIGSPVSASPTLRANLQRYMPHLKGTTLHFVDNGEYSAAIGAYLDIAERR